MTALLALSFAGCGKKTDNGESFDKNTVYKETPIEVSFPKDFEGNNFFVAGDRIVFTGYSFDDTTYESRNYLGSMKFDGSDMKITEIDRDNWINEVIGLDDGNVLALMDVYIPSEDPDEYGENKTFLVLFDQNGKSISQVDLHEELKLEYAYRLLSIEDYFYLQGDDGSFYQLDKNLKVVKKINSDEATDFSRIYKLKNGSYVATSWTENGMVFKKFDPKSFSVGEVVESAFDLAPYGIYEGKASGYDFLLSDSTQYLGFNLGETKATPIINFINSDIESNYYSVFEPLSDGSFISVSTEYDENGSRIYVNSLTKVNPEDIKEKEILTLGCVWLDSSVRRDVVAFNKSHDDVRITVMDYQSYNTEDDYMAGYKKLNSDIATGHGPDILLGSYDGQIAGYAKKGLFIDLNSMIDKDSEINKDDFCQNVLELMSQNGKLYFLSESFTVSSLIGKKKFLGERTSWTLDEMKQVEKSLPDGTTLFIAKTREEFLSNVVSSNYYYYIDEINGKCNFDNEGFINLLEYTKGLPEGNDDYYTMLYDENYYQNFQTAFRENRVVLSDNYIYSIEDLPRTMHGQFGEPTTYIGYPCENGNGSTVQLNSIYAISSKSKNKDAAWEFVRTKFTPDYQNAVDWMLPVNKDALRKLVDKATKPRTYVNYETGEEEEYEDYYYLGDVEIKINPLTQAEADEIYNFLLSVDKLNAYLSGDISDIINEEIAPFYNNQKSASEVAKIIQNRVSIMLAEKQ